VYDSIVSVVDYGLANRVLDGIRSIGIDELAIWAGHNYITMVYQIDAGVRRLLWIGKERTKETVIQCFNELGT
jgi:transposase